MRHYLYLAVFMALLGGCVPIAANPQRDAFGISTARPETGHTDATQDDAAKLAWKASQICLHGYVQTQQAIEPAEGGQQIVDTKLRCGHYDHWDFDYVHMNWSNLL